jgi:hypothetical protein
MNPSPLFIDARIICVSVLSGLGGGGCATYQLYLDFYDPLNSFSMHISYIITK